MGCKWGEPDDEPPIGRVIPTAPSLHGSHTDVDVDSDSDEGDSSLLLDNDEVVEVSEHPPLVVDINPSINMTDVGLAQDGTGQPPAAQAANFSSKDRWLSPRKFTGTSAEDAQLWWNSFHLFKNFKELTDQRALAMFPLMLKDGAMTWYLGQSAATKANCAGLQDAFKERYFPQEINKRKRTSPV